MFLQIDGEKTGMKSGTKGDSTINPGFTARVSENDFRNEINPGPMLYCPSCKSKMMEAEVKSLYKKCKHCRKWVYMLKVKVVGQLGKGGVK